MSQISNGSKVMILCWPHTALWCCLASTFKSCNERSQVLNQAVPQNLPFQLHLLPFSSHCMRLPLHFTVMMVLDEWWGDSCQTECFVWQLKTSVLFSSHHRIFCLMLSGSFGNLQARSFFPQLIPPRHFARRPNLKIAALICLFRRSFLPGRTVAVIWILFF